MFVVLVVVLGQIAGVGGGVAHACVFVLDEWVAAVEVVIACHRRSRYESRSLVLNESLTHVLEKQSRK